MKFPKTIKSTARIRIVELCDGKKVKVTKTRDTVRLAGQNTDGAKWLEKSRTVKGWKWHSEDLGVMNLSRLEMEKTILNLCGNDIKFMNSSFEEWHL